MATALMCAEAFGAAAYEWEPMDGPYGGSVSGLRRGHDGEPIVQANREYHAWSTERMSWIPVPPSPSTDYETDDRGSWYWLDITGIDRRADVLRSDDQGETWQHVLGFYGEFSWGPLTVSGERVYVNTPGGSWGVSHYVGGLMYSPDQGRSWIRTAPGRVSSWVVEGDTVYATGADGLSRSDDGGVTWRVVSNNAWLPYARSIARYRGSLYAAAYDLYGNAPIQGLYRSDDDGATWTIPAGADGEAGFRELLATPTGLYTTTWRAGVLFSADGITWEALNRGLPPATSQLEVVDGHVYADGRRSADGGDTWEPPGVSLPGTPGPSYRNAMIGHGPVRYFHRGDDDEIWSSTDSGGAWGVAVSGVDEGWFTFLTVDGDRHFLVGDNNTYLTVDGGKTLNVVAARRTLPYRTSTVAWLGADLYLGTTQGGVWRSADGGTTWSAAPAIPDGMGVNGFTSVDGTPFAATDRGVFVARETRRGGITWRRADLPSDRVTAALTRDGVVYAASGRQVYRSHDIGRTWHVTGSRPTPRSIVSLAADANTVYAGVEGGFFRMALPTESAAPPAFRIRSQAHRLLASGATDAGVMVDLAGHTGPWQWRLDDPFPAKGAAGGVEVRDGERGIVSGLAPGRIHRIYATPTTDGGDIAYPGVQQYVTVFASSNGWESDRKLSETRIAYWLGYGLTLSRPSGRITSEPGLQSDSLGSDLPPAWAPDGVRLLVVARYGESATVLNAIAGTRTQLSTAVTGSPRAWSPAGGQFAIYSWDETLDRTSGVYLTPLSGGPATRIAGPANLRDRFTWSPDAAQVAYMRDDQAWIAPVSGGAPRPTGLPSTPDFSPDGTRIAYVRDGDIYVANVDGSNETRLVDLPLDASDPSWSPDASRLVFWVEPARSQPFAGIHTVGADGQDLIRIADSGRRPSWSPFPVRASAPSIRVLAPAPGQAVGLSPGPDAATVRVDIRRHASGWNWKLDEPFPVSGPAGGTHVSRGKETVARGFAPGSEHVVYVALVDEQGDVLQPPVVDTATFLAPPVDPDAAAAAGSHIAYVSRLGGSLHVLRADGADRRTVEVDTVIGRIGRVRWSPSGRAAFAASPAGDNRGGTRLRRLFVTDANTGIARLTGEAVAVRDPDWSPDGERIVYVAGPTIETANPNDGGDRRVVADGGEPSRPRYSPDGTEIAFLSFDHPDTSVHAVGVTGAGRRVVASGQTAAEAFCWDPLGTRLAVGMPGLIYLLDNTDAEPRLIRAGTLMSWSPDGRWIAYVGPEGGFSLHDVHTGESRNLLKPDYRRFVVDTAWAPDSRRIACVVVGSPASSRGVARILPVARGEDEPPLRGLQEASVVSWPNYVVPTPSKVTVAQPHAGAVFPAPTTSVEIAVESDSAWRWRVNGYFPASGEAGGSPGSDEPVASGGLRAGRVYTVRVAAVDDNGDLLYPRDVTSVSFTVTIPADANADGIVDMRDLAYVAANFGRWGEFAGGEPDVDGSGAVRVEDLMLVAAHFGERIAPHAPAAPSLPGADSAGSLDDWNRRAERVNADTRELRAGLATLRALLARVTPTTTALHPNYPNPFNPETWIPFDLAATSAVTVTLYDMRGRQVRRLDLGTLPAGRYRDRTRARHWDGRNEFGEHVGSGVYIAELRAGGHVERRRIVLLK